MIIRYTFLCGKNYFALHAQQNQNQQNQKLDENPLAKKYLQKLFSKNDGTTAYL